MRNRKAMKLTMPKINDRNTWNWCTSVSPM